MEVAAQTVLAVELAVGAAAVVRADAVRLARAERGAQLRVRAGEAAAR